MQKNMKFIIILVLIMLFLITLSLFFIFSQTRKGESKQMISSNCLTEENFKLAVDHIKNKGLNNKISINGWNLEYLRNNEWNRISFSKSNENNRLGFVTNEKGLVEVVTTIIFGKQNATKEEISRVYCKLVQTIIN